MLITKKENIFNVKVDAIVCPINTIGIMGAGLALQFKRKYPIMFKNYRKLCLQNKIKIGHVYFSNKYKPNILLFPTKVDWRNPSKLNWIELGLIDFVNKYKGYGIKSIAFPKLGSGLGKLNWNDVFNLMKKYLNDIELDVYILL